VQPYLTPLILGETATLDRPALDAVAKWITLKMMIAEHIDPDSAVTPRPLRLAFRNTGEIPEFMRIYLASHDLPFEKSIGYRRNSQALALRLAEPFQPNGGATQAISTLTKGAPRPSPPFCEVASNIQTITFFLGRVFVHVTSARLDDFKVDGIALISMLYDTARIWSPNDAEMAWPREPAFTLKQVESIGERITGAINIQQFYWTNKVSKTGGGAAG
jgi:hypothetical protein